MSKKQKSAFIEVLPNFKAEYTYLRLMKMQGRKHMCNYRWNSIQGGALYFLR